MGGERKGRRREGGLPPPIGESGSANSPADACVSSEQLLPPASEEGR